MTTSNSETLACLIIDDPTLRPSYGCLNYEDLLRAMKDHRFFTEIAFIPYNWRRSDPETVRLFLENPDHLAICVHGCDHTGGEFGSPSYDELRRRAETALDRMDRHEELTGLGYDPVMVFPQGRFSAAALKALRDVGYAAAFNSGLTAQNGEAPPAAEHRLPATRFFHDFPLFTRHYPSDRDAFARDFEAGRPLIAVEHHGVFRDGYGAITDFADWINALGDVRWTSLGEIVERYVGPAALDRPAPAALTAPRDAFNLSVSARRFFSELRDEYIETNAFLETRYRRLRKMLR